MEQSRSPPRIMSQWKTQRPYFGGMRTSNYFHWSQHEMCLQVEVYSDSRDYDYIAMRVQWRRKPPSFDSTLIAHGYVTVGNLVFHGETEIKSRYLETKAVPVKNIFHKNLSCDQEKLLMETEVWTVVCEFGFGFRFVEIERETISLTTVDDTIQPSMHQCVQVSSEVPGDTEALSRDYSRLLDEEMYPDFQLSCEGRIFKVHRGVLAARSEVFRAMFRNTMQESRTGSAAIEDLQASVLYLLLKFVYSGRLDVATDAKTVGQLYEAADKYAVRSLVTACTCYMLGNVSEENCISFVEKADLHSDNDLKAAAASFIVQHPSVFQSEAWGAFSAQRPALAIDVLQAYVSSMNQ